MKKCPFCAEEIQDEAIKCKHCGSMLNEPVKPPAPEKAETSKTAEKEPAAAAEPEPRTPLALMAAGSGKARAPHPDEEKTFIYEGSPSWRAFFGSYVLVCLLTPAVAAGALYGARHFQASGLVQALSLLVPLAAGVVAFFTLGLMRKADRVRMTNRSVEHEEGVFSKRIEVLELWRIKDVRYRQSLLDRLLGIAHIDVFSKDVTTPHLEVVGLPASREVFEKLRDSIEIQRQSHRVMGIID